MTPPGSPAAILNAENTLATGEGPSIFKRTIAIRPLKGQAGLLLSCNLVPAFLGLAIQNGGVQNYRHLGSPNPETLGTRPLDICAQALQAETGGCGIESYFIQVQNERPRSFNFFITSLKQVVLKGNAWREAKSLDP